MEGDHLEATYVVGRIILKWTLKELNGRVWIGLIWPRIGTSDW
jgi:hypothetical protein